MKQLLKYALLLFLAILAGCLPKVDTIDPSSVEWTNYTTANGLAGNQVNTIVSDQEGTLWIGTNNGVSKFDGTTFTNYQTTNGLLNNFVTSIVEYEPGFMLFGTNGGLSILDHGNWFSILNLDGNNTPYSVTSMGVDKKGLVWIGTDTFGLLYIDQNSFYQEWDYGCSNCNYVNYMYLDSKNVMWFGTNGGLKKLQGTSFIQYTTTNGLPNNSVQSVFEDSWGTLWVGTYNGLSTLEGSGFIEKNLYNTAPQNWAYTINQDAENKVWVGSIGNGLIYFNGSAMRTNPESLADKRISTISSFKDSNGALWFGTFEGGLWKYTPNLR